MFARVTRFEGIEPGRIDEVVAGLEQALQGPPPPGLEGVTEVLMLIDRERGRCLTLNFFDDERALHEADAVLGERNQPTRTAVELYEVALKRRPFDEPRGGAA